MSTTARGTKAADAEKANQELIASLKFKVKELEHEVSTLRGRLEDLRKAKNTTITKREREIVEVGFKRDPHYEAKLAELEKQLRDKSATKNREIEELKRKHAEALEAEEKRRKDLQKELDDLNQQLEKERKDLDKQKKIPPCNHEDLLHKLRTQITDLEGDNSALIIENKDIKDRVNSLHLELSVKEAKWCEKEEQYQMKLKQQWGDKYAEWMAETEKKINELQEANQLLRMYLHRSGQRLPPEASAGGSKHDSDGRS